MGLCCSKKSGQKRTEKSNITKKSETADPVMQLAILALTRGEKLTYSLTTKVVRSRVIVKVVAKYGTSVVVKGKGPSAITALEKAARKLLTTLIIIFNIEADELLENLPSPDDNGIVPIENLIQDIPESETVIIDDIPTTSEDSDEPSIVLEETTAPATNLRTRPIVAAHDNPVNRLQELCQARKWRLPAYELTEEWTRTSLRFKAVCLVTMANNSTVRAEGVAGNKKDAKKLSATTVHDLITGKTQNVIPTPPSPLRF